MNFDGNIAGAVEPPLVVFLIPYKEHSERIVVLVRWTIGDITQTGSQYHDGPESGDLVDS